VEDVSIGLYGRTVLRLVPMAAITTAAAAASTIEEDAVPTQAHILSSPLSAQALLPAHRFTTGDEVEIRSVLGSSSKGSGNKGRMVGVICEVSNSSLSVALGGGGGSGGGSRNNGNKKKAAQGAASAGEEDDAEGWAQPPLSLLSRDSVEVHRKLVAALDRLERRGSNDSSRVVRALMDPAAVVVPLSQEPSRQVKATEDPVVVAEPPFVPVDSGLDGSQRQAVAFCLDGSCPVSCVWGPPGTGKTTTIVEVIRQAVARQWKVLVTAPSNVAVDNVLAKLVVAAPDEDSAKDGKRKKVRSKGGNNARGRIRAVRIGHPARMRPEIVQYSLDSLVQRSEGTAIVADVRNELRTFVQMLSSSSKRRRVQDRALAKREISSLRKEIRTREEKVVAELLGNAQVVLATCVGAANRLLADAEFDMVVIDEAAQALEVACWIPALLCTTKLVLAGDHKQLPPTIKSSAVQRELGYTMFERIMDQAPALSRMLQVQYRMHETIADWASHAMYHDQLVSHETVRHRTLGQLMKGAPDAVPAASDGDPRRVDDNNDEHGEEEEDTPPFLLIDTAGCGMHENANPAGSRYNVGEAEIVTRQVRHLVGLGLKPEQIAVITPYNGQVETLRNSLSADFPKLDIRSVDGFQGGEREAVLISLVRSSPGSGRDGIGFLSDERRLNVAITRSKRHCCVVCDSDTVQQSRFIRGLLEWISEHGHHQSAREYLYGEHAHESRNLGASLAMKSVLELQKETNPEEIAKNHALLVERIRTFAANGKPGAEMKLSATLSRFDRKIVHEEAERLEIGHMSEGVEGVNRRIKLFIPKAPNLKQETTTVVTDDPGAQEPALQHLRISETSTGTQVPGIDDVDHKLQRQSFQALAELLVEDSDELDAGVAENFVDGPPPLEEKGTSRSLLSELARERMDRQRGSDNPSRAQQPSTKPKRVGGGGQKLGGSNKSSPARSQKSETHMVEMDDMAFLDQQIEQVQNAHGRKFEGKGGYRTVMNGILNATPTAASPAKKDPRASAALQAKLKSAKDVRKAKK
jgi:AAA domain